MEHGGAGLRLEPHDIRGFGDGALGWAVAGVTFVFPDGRRLPTRLTMVLRQQNGDWKILHAYFSVAVPDELALDHACQWLEQLGQTAPV